MLAGLTVSTVFDGHDVMAAGNRASFFQGWRPFSLHKLPSTQLALNVHACRHMELLIVP